MASMPKDTITTHMNQKSDLTTCLNEEDEQVVVVEYCDSLNIPCFHIPNGGSRHPAEAANLKRQGVKPGVPDLFLPIARGEYHGLFIEMKRRTKYHVQDNQIEWIKRLRAQGYAAWACAGSDNAIACIEWYMAL